MNRGARAVLGPLVALLLTGAVAWLAACAVASPIPYSPTPGPTVASSPTPSPVPSPTPLPASVVLPPPVQPAGRLFPSGLYAVLKGEGSRFDILDGTGAWVQSFSYVPWNLSLDESLNELFDVVGLDTATELAAHSRVGEDRVVLRYPTDELKRFGNGYFQLGLDQETYHAVLYDASGKVVRVLSFPVATGTGVQMCVDDVQGRTVVFEQSRSDDDPSLDGTDLTVLTSSGILLAHCAWKVPGIEPVGLLGMKYFVVDDVSTGITIRSSDGSTLMSGIDGLLEPQSLARAEREASFYFEVADYFLKDGVVYGSDLKPVLKDALDRSGRLIPGVTYDVQGIPCVARTDSLAVGAQGGRLAFRTRTDAHSVAIAAGESYLDRRGDRLLLDDETAGRIRAVSLATGATLWTLDARNGSSAGTVGELLFLQGTESGALCVVSLVSGRILYALGGDASLEVADDYAIVHTSSDGNPYGPGFFVLDAKGNLRYQSKADLAHATHGTFFALQRGPYLGIADLNGNWVVKALRWDLANG